MPAMQYNEDRLKIIGALLPSHRVDEGGPLLQVLDILKYVDRLKLARTSSAMHGMLRRYFA